MKQIGNRPKHMVTIVLTLTHGESIIAVKYAQSTKQFNGFELAIGTLQRCGVKTHLLTKIR